jgi:hypothetical protein
MPAGMVRPRASRAAHVTGMPRGPYGVWMVGGTPVRDRYPCRCHGTRECGRRCWCRGRLDGAEMPALCCARRELETGARIK